jgi:hypothetical protein
MLTRGSLKRKGAPALDMTSPANDLYDLSIHRLNVVVIGPLLLKEFVRILK